MERTPRAHGIAIVPGAAPGRIFFFLSPSFSLPCVRVPSPMRIIKTAWLAGEDPLARAEVILTSILRSFIARDAARKTIIANTLSEWKY